MKTFRTRLEWLDRLLPEGIPIPSSTVISGPGGSGKPLIGLGMVAAWLRAGGKAILIPLQYPDRSFTEEDMARLYDLHLTDYAKSICFIRFDLDLEPGPNAVEACGANEFRANVVHPEAWIRALDRAEEAMGEATEPGMLVYASALNLLLFSPTYGERTRAQLVTLLREDRRRTYLFTVSSSALKDKIETLEQAADHLMYSHMDRKERKLHFRVARLRGAPYLEERIEAPFSRETLAGIKEMADESRVTRIPAIRRI